MSILSSQTLAENYLLNQAPFFHHALKTPLQGLKLSLDLLESNPNSTGTQNLLIQAQLQLERLNQLLTEAQVSKVKSETFVSHSCLQEVTFLTQKPNATISLNCHPQLCMTAPKIWFQETMICLINNGLESYPHQTRPWLMVSAQVKNQEIEVAVVDGGQGIAPLKLREVATPGYTTKTHGSGQGLSFAKYFVEEVLHGTLSLSSQLHQGSQVILRFPLQP